MSQAAGNFTDPHAWAWTCANAVISLTFATIMREVISCIQVRCATKKPEDLPTKLKNVLNSLHEIVSHEKFDLTAFNEQVYIQIDSAITVLENFKKFKDHPEADLLEEINETRLFLNVFKSSYKKNNLVN